MSKTIEIIEATVPKASMAEIEQTRKLRVAAYARVSTDQDEQESSYEAQVDYYTKYINSNPNWEFCGVFADRGITGTNTKYRESFNKMINLALNGEIDLILTKSISRFARNTVDALTIVRRLKARNVEVIFEKENLHSLDPKCEVMLTIMSSLAQEESRSISENVRWGIRKSMQEGKVNLPYACFLGYRKGEDGRPEIVEEEAKIVREIYDAYLSGKSIHYIADELTARGIPTPMGKSKWSVSTIRSILGNEKYKGDALLQKTYVEDFLSKKVKKNNGELPSVLVHESHDAIIEPEIFDLVQEKLSSSQAPTKVRPKTKHPFHQHIVCGDCGRYYGHKYWKKRNGERYCVWYCDQPHDGPACQTPRLKEEEIITLFGKLLKQLHYQDLSYTPERFKELVEKVTVYRDGRVEFILTDGGVETISQ